jgi:UDP-GlcNAc:undecaprenyl-phosphate GlcNAc-1-phosphate transferase
MELMVAALTGAAVALPVAVWLIAHPPRRLLGVNIRGRRVPIVLGLAAEVGTIAGTLAGIAIAGEGAAGRGQALWILGATGLVVAAGLLDDLVSGTPRGLRGHGRELLRGRVTPGMVKLLAAVAAGIVVVVALPSRATWEMTFGVVLVAGCANVWNGLDVVPGRALKAFLVFALALVAIIPRGGDALVLAALIGGVLAVGAFDLRERAMLGDAGANLLGIVLGAHLYAILPPVGVVVAAAVTVGLNAAAETITLSRLIEETPPLRWIDRAGRSDPSDRSPPRT